MTILAPSATKISAVRRPMPLVAPVITATLPSSRPMLVLLFDKVSDISACGATQVRVAASPQSDSRMSRECHAFLIARRMLAVRADACFATFAMALFRFSISD